MGHTDTADHKTGELCLFAFPFTVSLAVGAGPPESTRLKVMSSKEKKTSSPFIQI